MNTDADQLTTREACTVLAALRLFQQVRPCDLCPDGTPIIEMEEFAKHAPLDLDEIDELYGRIKSTLRATQRPRQGLLEPRPLSFGIPEGAYCPLKTEWPYNVLRDSRQCGHDYTSRTIRDHGAGAFKGYAARDVRPQPRFLPGYRYRLHAKDLPGRPDLVFRTRRKVIFVHGCFWHRTLIARCQLPNRGKILDPKSKAIERGQKIAADLHRLGWSVMTIWECELSKPDPLATRIRRFLNA